MVLKDYIISFLRRRKSPEISRLFPSSQNEIMVICEGISDAYLLRKIKFTKGVVFVPTGFLHTDMKGEFLILNNENSIHKGGKNRVMKFLEIWLDDYAIVDMDDDLAGSLIHKRVIDSRNATLLFGRILDLVILKKELTIGFKQIYMDFNEEKIEHCFKISEFFGKQKVGNKSLNSHGSAYKPERIFTDAKDFQMLIDLAHSQNKKLIQSTELPTEINYLNDHALECSLKILYLDEKRDTSIQSINWHEFKKLRIQELDELFKKSCTRSVKELKLEISRENGEIILSDNQ